MIFKVYYQEVASEVPVREKTKAMYIESDTEENVRKKLSGHGYNIEFVQKLEGKYLEYEQNHQNYKLEQL
ncbi:DNA-dependent RNA polymerase subunit epsilon [Jeotgalibacillus sp. JSM ZJ347]|uniref:DNA-dependent RNA polymerase subunit epsilon n=1 Tax=Jeotgalibacillus sp. JSM ZJ347 TaxID=3342117 RepID=UPI0035A923C3